MAYDNGRGQLYDSETDTIFDMGRVIDEDDSFKAGIVKINLPLLDSDGAYGDSVLGKVRVINLRGVKHGTQLQIEAFIKQFTDHVDKTGLQSTIRYYPFFHPDNSASEGSQNSYYKVLINDFTRRATRDRGGFVLEYDLELFQMNSVLETLTAS